METTVSIDKEFISQALLEKMIKGCSLSSIIENSRAKELIQFNNCNYIISGGSWGPAPKGCNYVVGYKAVDLEAYTGDKEPLQYLEHFDQVTLGHRDRSYCGMKIKYQNKWIVLTGPRKYFYPLPEEKQLTLF